MNGTVAAFDDEEPLYYVAHGQNEFLGSLLQRGPEWLRAAVAENEKQQRRFSRGERLVSRFCTQAHELGFRGQIKREYPLNLSQAARGDAVDENFFGDMSAKSIDILHRDGDRYDVIEAKSRLNWEALGQALGYAELLCLIESVPRSHVRSHIVCEQTDAATYAASQRLGVNVIRLKIDE